MHGAAEALAQGGDGLLDLLLGADDDFGSGRGSGGAQVGDKIADGEVGLVADGRDDGDFSGGDGARQRFVVECGEVFDTASAAGDEDDIDDGAGRRLWRLK